MLSFIDMKPFQLLKTNTSREMSILFLLSVPYILSFMSGLILVSIIYAALIEWHTLTSAKAFLVVFIII